MTDRIMQTLLLMVVTVGTIMWIWVLTHFFGTTLVLVVAGVAAALIYRAATE